MHIMGQYYIYKYTVERGCQVVPAEPEDMPQTQRKCECGVWSTGGLHSDWCPCAGGDCVQKEDR
jgi:hypothetical protein